MATSYLNAEDTSPELQAQRLISNKKRFNAENVDYLSDADWLKQSFLIQSGAVTDEEKINRTFTSAEFKFQDSTLGGNYVINPHPQFTRYCDTPIKGQLGHRDDMTVGGSSPHLGPGAYWSEALDDNSQVIHMRFGVPQFNSMTTFLTGFFNARTATAARTGRINPGFFRQLGEFAGFLAYVVFWPVVLVNYAATAIMQAMRFSLDKPSSSYYFFKPTMPIYWTMVNSMVNDIGIKRGLFPAELEANSDQYNGQSYKIDKATMETLAAMMPDVFKPTGGIDVYSISSRGQRIKNALDKALMTQLQESVSGDINDVHDSIIRGFVKKFNSQVPVRHPGDRGTIENIINLWGGIKLGKSDTDEKSIDFERSLKLDENGKQKPYEELTDFENYLKSEYDDGGAFVSFRVNNTGPIQESFTNTLVDTDLATKFNSVSAANKSAYFSLAGGNLVGGVLGSTMSGIKDALLNFSSGVLDTLNISGIVALGGSAFINIPKHWEDSQTQFPRANYTISLTSPYGNPISQMMNIYIPLSMLLVGALPRLAGRQAYTSPFLCQLYDKGRQQTRLGMIDSITINRGTSNLGFNKEGHAMRIDVTFSVAELNSVMAVPVSATSFISNITNPLDSVLDDENAYTDYINVLSSVSLYDQLYTSSRLNINIARRMREYQQLTSKARMAMFIRNDPLYIPTGWLDIFFKGAQRDGSGSLRSGLFENKPPI